MDTMAIGVFIVLIVFFVLSRRLVPLTNRSYGGSGGCHRASYREEEIWRVVRRAGLGSEVS
jgi:hypothetical protein